METEGAKQYINIEKIAFKVVQMKVLAMHITNQKISWYIYSSTFTKYLYGTWSLLNDFWHKRKINNFDPYNVLLAIATNSAT